MYTDTQTHKQTGMRTLWLQLTTIIITGLPYQSILLWSRDDPGIRKSCCTKRAIRHNSTYYFFYVLRYF